jgi:DNA-binding NarL/FixJ family response regulator
VDSHPVVREQMAALLQRAAGLEVCGTAADALTALSLIGQHQPDLLIMDISSNRSERLELIKTLKALHPRLRVLAMALQDNRLHAERALQAGAAGYITKQEATVAILSAVRCVLAGQRYLTQPKLPPIPAVMTA